LHHCLGVQDDNLLHGCSMDISRGRSEKRWSEYDCQVAQCHHVGLFVLGNSVQSTQTDIKLYAVFTRVNLQMASYTRPEIYTFSSNQPNYIRPEIYFLQQSSTLYQFNLFVCLFALCLTQLYRFVTGCLGRGNRLHTLRTATTKQAHDLVLVT